MSFPLSLETDRLCVGSSLVPISHAKRFWLEPGHRIHLLCQDTGSASFYIQLETAKKVEQCVQLLWGEVTMGLDIASFSYKTAKGIRSLEFSFAREEDLYSFTCIYPHAEVMLPNRATLKQSAKAKIEEILVPLSEKIDSAHLESWRNAPLSPTIIPERKHRNFIVTPTQMALIYGEGKTSFVEPDKALAWLMDPKPGGECEEWEFIGL